jgi:hypothetical protein
MTDVIINEHDLGQGWSLWTEYKPFAEDKVPWGGPWGWFFALEKEGDSIDVDWWPEANEPSTLLNDWSLVSDLDSDVFGPFDNEEGAIVAGRRLWEKVVDDPELWQRWADEDLDNHNKFTRFVNQ